MLSRWTSILSVSMCLTFSGICRADWKQLLESLSGEDGGGPQAVAAPLTNDEMVRGLKEALAQGTGKAVDLLGRADGFFGNSDVRISVPENLKSIESGLRTLKQDKYADEFILTMNRAAESAVPEARAILVDAIQQMTVDDAKGILNGPDDAATRYFRKVGGERIAQRMRPIVSDATSRAGVTSAYKTLIERAGFAAKLAGADSVDIDGYVTREALNGLFLLIAREEKRIRDNPVARTTDLLKKVFAGRSP